MAEGERREQVDRADEQVGAGRVEQHSRAGQLRRERVELGPHLGPGLLAVDAVDVDERTVALAAARLARRALDLVAGAKLAAAHLGRGDVDVAVAGHQALEAQEAVALAGDLEHAARLGGRLVLVREVTALGALGPELDRLVGLVVEHGRLDHDTIVRFLIRFLVRRLIRFGSGGVGVILLRLGSRGGGVGVILLRLGSGGIGVGASERLDQLVAAELAVAGDARGSGPLVQVGEVKVLRIRGHRRAG